MRLPGRPPAAVRALVGDEDPLAWGAAGEVPVVATRAALWLGPDRLGWEDVARAVYEEPVLTIEPVRGEPVRVRLTEPGRLPDTVRDRVTASVLLSRTEQVAPRTTARVVARRVHGEEHPRWTLEVTGPHAQDADARAAAEEVLRAARASVGD